MFFEGIAIGIAGTIAMDFWALLAHRIFAQPLPNWAMPGRWLGHALRGKLTHPTINEAPRIKHELGLGWAFHYGVGAVYGLVWLMLAGPQWLALPSLLPVLVFAWATIAAGWFILQPGMGLGWAAAKTPNPWKVRGMGLVAHTAFGLGLWAGALLL